MEKIEVIKSIGQRSGGDIYLGVVGAVRTGKSTFIRKFMVPALPFSTTDAPITPSPVESVTLPLTVISCADSPIGTISSIAISHTKHLFFISTDFCFTLIKDLVSHIFSCCKSDNLQVERGVKTIGKRGKYLLYQ